MPLKRSRNIGDLRTRLIKKLSKQKKEEGFDWGQLNPMEWGFLGGGYSDDKPMYDTEGEFEGKEIAEMNAVLADPGSSPPIQKIGSLLSAEGESPLDQVGREYMDRRKTRREAEEEFAAMENPPEDSYGDKLSSYLGQAGDYVTGLFSPEEKEYRDVDTEGDNRYLNKLARERFAEQKAMSKRLDLPGISKKISGQYSPELSADKFKMMGPQYESNALTAAYLADDDESELDRIGRENMLNKELGPDKIDVESSFGDRLSQGRIGDAFSGLFASDDEDGKKKKKMSKGAMKVGADLLKSYLQEPSGRQQRQMPTSSITRGSVPFAGLLSQKPQRQKTPYFVPKGLV